MRRLHPLVRLVLFAVGGSLATVAVTARVHAPIGPFDTTAVVRPALSGATVVRLAPLGTISLDTHDAPVVFELRVDELRLDEAERIARDPSVLEEIEDDIAADASRAAGTLAMRSVVAALAGGVAGGLLASLRWRSATVGAITASLVVAGVGVAVVATFNREAVGQPRYSGLLTHAPTAVGDVASIVDRFDEYQAQLSQLVGNVVSLYRAGQALPGFDTTEGTTRLLHVSDVHNNPQAFDLIEQLVDQFTVDAVVDTGDITDWGSEPESRLLDRIARLDVPYVWVRGNHDSGRTQQAVANQPNAIVLDGDAAVVAGVRLWGIGDPRYTAKKNQPVGKDIERDQAEAFAPVLARRLHEDDASTVDVVLVHDARTATEIGGVVPLVLAGHTHDPEQAQIDETLLLVEGSTGGAGLRGLKGEEPEALTCSILYLDAGSDRLVAYDRITVDGFGGAGARIERRVVETESETDPAEATAS